MRLKCEAYSTLNECDEDPSVEERLRERFIQSVAIPPSGALLAPAALYLTAILEYVFFSVCFDGHVLLTELLHIFQGHVRVRIFDKNSDSRCESSGY